MVTINSENNKNIKPSGDVADTIYNSGSTVTIDVGSGNDLVINGYIDDDGVTIWGGSNVTIRGGMQMVMT